ncbi:MAG: AEC family transporter [Anaeroplasmataceae bacterium]
MDFFLTFYNVLIVLLMALPGFLLIKAKMVHESNISVIATVLLYVNSPCLVIYSFQSVDRSKKLGIDMLLFIIITLITQAIMILLYLVIMKLINKRKKIKYDNEGNTINTSSFKVGTVGVALGNVGFFGVPIIQALLPEHPEAVVYSTMFCISMNIIAFSLGAFIITGDKKYMSWKKIFINPTTISALVALPLFLLDFKIKENFGDFGPILDNAITLLGKMTTPMCMLVLGMRLANVKLKALFTNYKAYIISFVKLVIFPLLSYLIVYFIPGLDYAFKASILILSAAPIASVILNLAEMLGSEQTDAANMVLISTILCIITMPLVLLVL